MSKPSAKSSQPAEYSLQALERGIQVLKVFSRENPALTLSDVARMTGMTRASARRILLSLESMGYARSDGRLFSLSPAAMDLSWGYLSSIGADEAYPALRSLCLRTGEHVSMGTLDLPDIVCVALIEAPRTIRIAGGIGARGPATASALGRVLLANLPDSELDSFLHSIRLQQHTPRTVTSPARLKTILGEVRGQGWALLDREWDASLVSLGAPIRDMSGQVIAGVAIMASAAHSTAAELKERCLEPLLQTTDEIGRTLSARAAGRAASGAAA